MTQEHSDPPDRAWASLTTVEVERAVARDPVIVLPLAAIEQHGPHLPLSTDLHIGMALLSEAFGALPLDAPVWALPPLAVGASGEHASFAGTITTSPEVLMQLVFDVGASLASAGVRRLVLSNSHGGNRPVLDAAGLRLRREHGLLVVKVHYGRFPPPEDTELPQSEWRHGLHGGAVETAMMMHIRPDLVRTSELDDFVSLGTELEESMRRLGPEGEASFAWLAEDVGARGVAGDAHLASADLGRKLIEHYGAALADVIRDAQSFPLARLGGPEGS